MRLREAAALVALAFGCSNASAPAPIADAGGAYGASDADDDAAPCLFCTDAGPPAWQNPALPLGTRMVSMLGDCTGAEACHAAGSGGMVILGGKETANMINVRSTERPELFRVAPFDPADSYVWLKLRGDGGIEGSPMPGGFPDPRRADLAWAWIEAGAPSP